MPTLHALVELCIGEDATWVPLPPGPWPEFVRLHEGITDSEVALVMQTRALYGSAAARVSYLTPEAIIADHRSGLPGGLAALGGPNVVYPSCCCGLDDWRAWHGLLAGSGTPWLGHDPSPFVEPCAGGFRVWPDGGLGEGRPPVSTSVLFTHSELSEALRAVQDDLAAAVPAVRRWGLRHVPAHAEELVRAYERMVRLTGEAAGG